MFILDCSRKIYLFVKECIALFSVRYLISNSINGGDEDDGVACQFEAAPEGELLRRSRVLLRLLRVQRVTLPQDVEQGTDCGKE